MLTFETGVELGKALSQIRNNTRRIDDLEGEMHELRSLVTRALLLGGLWLVGVAGNLKADTIGEGAAAFLKAWLK